MSSVDEFYKRRGIEIPTSTKNNKPEEKEISQKSKSQEVVIDVSDDESETMSLGEAEEDALDALPLVITRECLREFMHSWLDIHGKELLLTVCDPRKKVVAKRSKKAD